MEPSERNQGTRVAARQEVLPSSDAFFRVAFGLVAQEIATITTSHPENFIVALVTPRTGEVDVHHVRITNNHIEALVVGRHDCADMALASDPSLSLRHALVLLKKDETEQGLIRILDLRSGTGLNDMKGNQHYSIAANGPIALRAAETSLFVLTPDVALENEPSESRYTAFEKIEWMDPVPWIPNTSPEKHLASLMKKRRETTAVSVVTEAKSVSKKADKRDGKPVGIIQIEVDNTSYNYDVDPMSLRAGVLVGRYGRCDLNDTSCHLPTGVSRVHALFLSMDERIHIFDVGSTNGLTYEDFPIRNLALPEHQPSTFEILDDVRISWVPGATTTV
jgi:hypothetical protein